ncbi:MAG: 2-oxoacid:acceptor oxidoreductase subunit alpha [Chloroflexi bacterium]|nr:2-oxoacid:acceptor oxidoreductase subunit alpha [Chloroflexota bacterium]
MAVKRPVDVNFMIGGEAGQGVQSVGVLLGKVFARGGFHVFADQDYESRIRGGHNFMRVRTSSRKTEAVSETVDMLLAINKETIDLHQPELASSGVIIYDGDTIKDVKSNGFLFSVPMARLAQEKTGDKLMSNTVALGAALRLVGYDMALMDGLLRDHFGGDVGEANVKAAHAGYDYAAQNFRTEFPHRLEPIGAARMFLTGNEAIALGAIAAGCKFIAAYPMTPATPILEYLATKAKDMDILVVQPEDEIAAINMALGASFAGLRAMTATSGSGFCLMVEGLGLAGVTETPCVIVNGQRPGPAVGLPTRTEQGDLAFVVHAACGDFPRAVLAPATIEDAFWVTVKAFNLAERYQVPVIILTDHYLAGSYATVDKFDMSRVTIDRGMVYAAAPGGDGYKRHKVTVNGISPRAFPGQKEVLVATDSDEHDEAGHLTESAEERRAQVQKRQRKAFELKHHGITPPELRGPKRADLTLIGWGSTYGAIKEAVELLLREGKSANWLHLNELWPFPAEPVADILCDAKESFVVESNASGQLAQIIRAETGKAVEGKILRYDGRPITPAYIVDHLRKESCCYGNVK